MSLFMHIYQLEYYKYIVILHELINEIVLGRLMNYEQHFKRGARGEGENVPCRGRWVCNSEGVMGLKLFLI